MEKNTDFFSQFTPTQMYHQYQRSLDGIRKLEEKARQTGKKIAGQTLAQHTADRIRYEAIVEEWRVKAGL